MTYNDDDNNDYFNSDFEENVRNQNRHHKPYQEENDYFTQDRADRSRSPRVIGDLYGARHNDFYDSDYETSNHENHYDNYSSLDSSESDFYDTQSSYYSSSQTEQRSTRFNRDEEDDFFNNDEEEVKNPRPVKRQRLDPENPDYWEQPESEFDHLIPNEGSRSKLWLFLGGLILILLLFCYFRYFRPCVEEATQYGYVENIERDGLLFKTYEGILLPYKDLMDTTRIYTRDFVFTAEPECAAQLRRMQYSNLPVRVIYRKYYGTLPWRGNSKIIVEKVDSVDPAKILPPEFAPKRRIR